MTETEYTIQHKELDRNVYRIEQRIEHLKAKYRISLTSEQPKIKQELAQLKLDLKKARKQLERFEDKHIETIQ